MGERLPPLDEAEDFAALPSAGHPEARRDYEGSAAWVEVTDHYRIPAWQYDGAGDGEQGGVIINLAPSGRVEVRKGLVSKVDRDTRDTTAHHPAAPKRPKAAYSGPLCRYIGWHKTLSVQELLLADARKAKEVAVVGMLKKCVRQLAKAEEPQRAYGVLDSQMRLFVGWLGFSVFLALLACSDSIHVL